MNKFTEVKLFISHTEHCLINLFLDTMTDHFNHTRNKHLLLQVKISVMLNFNASN